jgi:hypothetical protein
MLPALMLTAALACKPYEPPAFTLACEGADQVRRDALGRETARWSLAPSCTRATCEAADLVRRDSSGVELQRWSMAPQCTRVRCEGRDRVRRDSRGVELERWVNAPAPYCPAVRVRLSSDPPLRFGLSSRG